MKFLINRNANVNIQDNNGNTPLQLSVMKGNKQAAFTNFLIKHGADKTIKNNNGENFFTYSKKKEKIEKICETKPEPIFNYSLEDFKENFTLVDNHLQIARHNKYFEKFKEIYGEKLAIEYKKTAERYFKVCKEKTSCNFWKFIYDNKFFENLWEEDQNNIQELNKTAPNRIWTVCENDNNTICKSGFHPSGNTHGFLVTEEEFTEDIYFIIDMRKQTF